MLEQIVLGSVLTGLTTVVHGFCTSITFRALISDSSINWAIKSRWLEAALVATMVVNLFLAAIFESWIWALTYVGLGAIPTLEEAWYFSTVTLTSLGYGDITLSGDWRLLASFEAANGMLLFGWSTALVFAVVQRLYRVRTSSGPGTS